MWHELVNMDSSGGGMMCRKLCRDAVEYALNVMIWLKLDQRLELRVRFRLLWLSTKKSKV